MALDFRNKNFAVSLADPVARTIDGAMAKPITALSPSEKAALASPVKKLLPSLEIKKTARYIVVNAGTSGIQCVYQKAPSGSPNLGYVHMPSYRLSDGMMLECEMTPYDGYYKVVTGFMPGTFIPARYLKLATSVGGAALLATGAAVLTGGGNKTPSVEDKSYINAIIESDTAVDTTNSQYSYVNEEDNALELYSRSISDAVGEGADSTLYYKNLAKVHNAFGAPFTFLNSTDPCYYAGDSDIGDTPKIGRSMLSTIYSNPAVFSICPGKAVYLPALTKDQKESALRELISNIGESAADALNVTGYTGGQGVLAEQLYEFQCDYNDYVNRLNALARVSAIMMGIGEKEFPGSTDGSKYKNKDYSYYTTSHRGDSGESTNKGILESFLWQLETGISSSFSDDQYIHFFLSNEGTSITENHTTTTAPSAISGLLKDGGDLHDISKSLNFLFGGAMSGDGALAGAAEDVEKLLADVGANSSNITSSLVSIMKGYIQGGRMVVPDMIDDVDYSNTVSCVLTFRSLSADPEDVFLRVILPTLAMLNFALPKQLANNMYGYPYIVKCYQRGIYNADLAVIGNMNIRRGGQDNTSWTQAGLPTEIEVSFDIIPLHSSLMGGNGRNPFLFMDNNSLLEYLGNLCGIDLNINNIDLKADLYANLIKGWGGDIPDVLGRKASNQIKNKIEGIFKFQ